MVAPSASSVYLCGATFAPSSVVPQRLPRSQSSVLPSNEWTITACSRETESWSSRFVPRFGSSGTFRPKSSALSASGSSSSSSPCRSTRTDGGAPLGSAAQPGNLYGCAIVG